MGCASSTNHTPLDNSGYHTAKTPSETTASTKSATTVPAASQPSKRRFQSIVSDEERPKVELLHDGESYEPHHHTYHFGGLCHKKPDIPTRQNSVVNAFLSAPHSLHSTTRPAPLSSMHPGPQRYNNGTSPLSEDRKSSTFSAAYCVSIGSPTSPIGNHGHQLASFDPAAAVPSLPSPISASRRSSLLPSSSQPTSPLVLPPSITRRGGGQPHSPTTSSVGQGLTIETLVTIQQDSTASLSSMAIGAMAQPACRPYGLYSQSKSSGSLNTQVPSNVLLTSQSL